MGPRNGRGKLRPCSCDFLLNQTQEIKPAHQIGADSHLPKAIREQLATQVSLEDERGRWGHGAVPVVRRCPVPALLARDA